MAVYNGGIRFAPDVYYDIKENGCDITVLRNGEYIGGGSNMLNINAVEHKTSDPDPEVYYVLDKTWKEIHDAFNAGTLCIVHTIVTLNDEPQVFADDMVLSIADQSVTGNPSMYGYTVDCNNIAFGADQKTDYPTTLAKN